MQFNQAAMSCQTSIPAHHRRAAQPYRGRHGRPVRPVDCCGGGGGLALYRKAFFGPVERESVAQATDLRPREWAVLVALIVMIAGIGIYPGPWIEIVRPAAEAWAAGLAR